MKDFVSVQKNMNLIVLIFAIGLSFFGISIALITSYSIYAIIFGTCSLIGLSLSIIILRANGLIGKVVINKEGISIKSKKKRIFVSWMEFDNCNIKHPLGRGFYKITLITRENKYIFYHEMYLVEKLIEYCTNAKLLEQLVIQKNN